jgi:hypothetical protein
MKERRLTKLVSVLGLALGVAAATVLTAYAEVVTVARPVDWVLGGAG